MNPRRPFAGDTGAREGIQTVANRAHVIPRIFLEQTTRHGEKTAFSYFDGMWQSISFNAYRTDAENLASHLIGNDVQKGDRVALIAENRPEWCIAYFAISLAGGVAVPMDAQMGPEEIVNLLVDSGAKAVFHSEKTREQVRKSIGMMKSRGGPTILPIDFDEPDFSRIVTTARPVDFPDVDEGDLASIIYTSGTTGRPKGVMLTHKNFTSDAEAIIEAGILSPDDSVISVLPLHHTYPFMGNCLIPAMLGLTVSFPPSLKGPDLMMTMRQNGVSVLVSVPQLLESIRNGVFGKIRSLPSPLARIMFWILWFCGVTRRAFGVNVGRVFFSSLHRGLGKRFRFAACGGAKLDPQIMKDLEALGMTILEGYGLTETSPVVTFNPIRKRKPGSVGRPLPTAEIRIVDPETGTEKGFFEEGEIVIRGPMVMKGYYQNPQMTAEVMKDGWFHSGDIGYLDREGYLFITGRLKEVIVLSSGKNIYPDEVEKRYLAIPLIREICVVGLERHGVVDSLYGIVVPDVENARRSGITNLKETVKWEINRVSAELPSYMRIKGFRVQAEPLPRTPLGKIRRFLVRDMLIAKGEEVEAKTDDVTLIADEVGGRVVECLRALMREKGPIRATDNLELDLGIDSLGRLELVVALEHAFSMKLPETFAADILTVAELVERIKEYRGEGIGEAGKTLKWRDVLATDPSPDDVARIGLHHGAGDRMIVFFGLNLIKIFMKVFFRLTAVGLEHLPVRGPYIIAPNHASYLDAFAIAAALPVKTFEHLSIVGVQKYFTGKVGKAFARLARVIPIDTDANLTRALQLSAYVLRKGNALLIFPEGGRSYDGEIMEFKKGVGILARELRIPVIPTYINGTFRALPRGAAWPKTAKITIAFGTPIDPARVDMSAIPEGMDEYQFLMGLVRERVVQLRK